MTPNEGEQTKRSFFQRLGFDDFWRDTVFFFAGFITAAGLESLFQNVIDGDFGITTNLAFFVVVLGLLVLFSVRTFDRVRRQVESQITEVRQNVETKAQETYIITRSGVSNIERHVQDSIMGTHRQVEDIHNRIVASVAETHDLTRSNLYDMRQEIARTARDIRDVVDNLAGLDVRVRYVENGLNLEEDPGYRRSLERILTAERSILIIGDYSPEWMPLLLPGERNKYLEAIENKIAEAIQDPELSFTYQRVIQRDRDIVTGLRGNGSTLRERDMQGDEQAFVHCYEAQNIKDKRGKSNDGVDVSFYLSDPIPNCPSMLLIDNKYMLFTVPIRTANEDNPDYIKTDGVLIFEDLDNGEAFANRFRKIFDRIKEDAVRVRIERPTPQLLQQFGRPLDD